MSFDPARYLVTAALLRSDHPLRLEEIVEYAQLPRAKVLNALWDLTAEGAVIEGHFITDQPGPQYAWAAGVRKAPREAITLEQARQRVRTDPSHWPQDLRIDSDLIRAFHDFVMNRYEPPSGKRWLILFQCSIRRPFSKSPSHSFLRRAVTLATGFDPAWQYRDCPAHVVVLASRIGPVPYEMENFYPANISGGGVKHFSDPLYEDVHPVLVERMAQYLRKHAEQYESIAAFMDARYAQVMGDAAHDAGVDVPIFPQRDGVEVVCWGQKGSRPRTYWQRYWIQLCLHLIRQMSRADQRAAHKRLAQHQVEYA